MNFANPIALHLGWLGIALIALYLIDLLRTKSKVAAEPIWNATFARQPRWNRWRKFASLSCHLLALAAIVLAAADLRWYNDTGRPVVLIVDISASTTHTLSEDDPTRFELIYEAAWQLVEKRPRLQKMAILAVGSTARWHCQFTTNQDVLRQAIPKQPTYGATSVQTAIELLEDVRIDGERPRIILVGDGCYPINETSQGKIEQLVLGESHDNQAITHFSLRPVPGQPGRQSLAMEVVNNSSQPVNLPLSVISHSRELFSREVSVAEGTSRIESFDVYVGDPALLQAGINRADSFSMDNETRVAFAPRQPIKVRVIGSQRWTDLFESLRQYEVLPDGSDKTADITAVFGQAPSPFPKGRVLVFDPIGTSPHWNSVTKEPWTPTSFVASHGGMATEIRLDSAAIDDYYKLDFVGQPTQQILAADGRPIVSRLVSQLVSQLADNVTVVHLGIDSSDLTKRADLAVFIDQLIQNIGSEDNLPYGSFSTADLVVRDRDGTESVQIFDKLQAEPVPVDLLSLQESNLRQIQKSELTVADITLGRMMSLSPALLLLAIALLTFEWRCFQRRQLI